MKNILLCCVVLCMSSGFSQIPPGYYNQAAFKTGNPLKVALHNIIDDHTIISYGDLWTKYASTDATVANKVWDMYSSVTIGTPAYTYSFSSDQCGNYNSEGDCYNREHSLPKSWFNDVAPMNSDLFHVYPTDGYVNGMRSNFPYGEVGSANNTSTNGSKVGGCNYPGYSGTVFEPIDEFKGDFARTYFYMMTRYMDVSSSWTSDMILSGDLSVWAEAMLLDWHLSDPVSAKEIDRNNAVYDIQNNRNPFIDHPEWVEYIWGPIAGIDAGSFSAIQAHYFDGVLYVTETETPTYDVEVMDMSGRLVGQYTSTSTEVILDDTVPGMYSIVISTDRTSKVLRVVK